MVLHEKSVFHTLPDLSTREGQQGVPVGGQRGQCHWLLLMLCRCHGGTELLLLRQPLQQLLLPGPSLLLPAQLLLLQDLLPQALLLLNLQAVQPRFFIFIGELGDRTRTVYWAASGKAWQLFPLFLHTPKEQNSQTFRSKFERHSSKSAYRL